MYNAFCTSRNTSVEEYYKVDNDTDGYYYLNSFENILVSGGEYCEHSAVVVWIETQASITGCLWYF